MKCNCPSCSGEPAQTTTLKPALGGLPYSAWQSGMTYTQQSGASFIASLAGIVNAIDQNGAEYVVEHLGDLNVSSMLYSAPSTFQPAKDLEEQLYRVWQYTDHSTRLSWDDYFCESCDMYVSKSYNFTHWDDICGTCSQHSGSTGMFQKLCECCSVCGYQNCECCGNCGEAPGYCECCSYCGYHQNDCECEVCDDCGHAAHNCSCNSHSGRFGSIQKAPWADRDKPVMPVETVPNMSECDNANIDPIRAAADFYLLDAMKANVRFSAITGGERAMNLLADQDRIVRNNDQLSAVHVSAQREYSRLVEQLDRTFLAYAISVVGGELRYHRAVSKTLPSSRSAAWDTFVGIVEENGADVLFDAVDLFEDFDSTSYGGHKWAQIAQVTAQRLSGKMPAWLFVDRIITLQHNGGCVLNKKDWARTNGLGWDISMMQSFLNAHAGCCSHCGQKADPAHFAYGCTGAVEITDFDLLLQAASPGVAHMFRMAEKALSRVAARVGGELPAIPNSPQKPRRRRNVQQGQCPVCSYYSCVC